MQTRSFYCAVLTPVLLVAGWVSYTFLKPADKYVPVSGFVVLDGTPLVDADIFFVSQNSGKSVTSRFGKSNDIGVYQILDGVEPGEYRVVVKKLLGEGTSEFGVERTETDMDDGQMAARMDANAGGSRQAAAAAVSAGAKLTALNSGKLKSLPEIYSSAEYTILRVTVPSKGTSAADLFLDSEVTEQVAESPSETNMH
ncbi:MAG: hypothetical protein WBH50_20195 [Fuerstiella sp.]